MYAVSEQFLAALPQSQGVALRADIWLGDERIGSDVALADAGSSLDCDTTSRIPRSANLIIADDVLRPWAAGDVLAPFGPEIDLWSGIDLGSSIEWCELGRLRLDTSSCTLLDAGIRVQASDRLALVDDNGFESAAASNATLTIPAQCTLLIHDAVPGAVVVDLTGSAAMCPRVSLLWDAGSSRLDAVRVLLQSIGCEVVNSPSGAFVMRRVRTLTGAADWTVIGPPADAVSASATLIDATRALSRANSWNAYTAASDFGVSPPVQRTAKDLNPTSPTRYGGPFGRITRRVSNPAVHTGDQAQLMADAGLAKGIGRTWSLDLTTLPNHAIEGGDRIDVAFPTGQLERHLVRGYHLELPTGAMGITAASTQPDADL